MQISYGKYTVGYDCRYHPTPFGSLGSSQVSRTRKLAGLPTGSRPTAPPHRTTAGCPGPRSTALAPTGARRLPWLRECRSLRCSFSKANHRWCSRTAACKDERSRPSSVRSTSTVWATVAGDSKAFIRWMLSWNCRPDPSLMNSNAAWSRPPYKGPSAKQPRASWNPLAWSFITTASNLS